MKPEDLEARYEAARQQAIEALGTHTSNTIDISGCVGIYDAIEKAILLKLASNGVELRPDTWGNIL